jgi:hypothetical protein
MTMKITFRIFGGLVAALVLALALMLAIPSVTCADQMATAAVSAPGSTVQKQQQFVISITVQPNSAIAGMQFDLVYNPTLVAAQSVAQGNLLTQNGASIYFNTGQIDNTAGKIANVFGVITDPEQSVSSAGTLATITFTAKNSSGTCPFALSNVIVGDPAGLAVPVNITNQAVEITGGTDSPPADPKPSGGGGGGGGVSGLTRIADFTTDEGRVVLDVIAEDDAQKVELVIPKDIIVRSHSGQTVSSIIMKPSTDSLAPNAGSVPVGPAYNIQPSGITFSPSATLIFKYNEADIPDGLSENSLYIALWDPDNLSWIDLGGNVDQEENTVSVEVEHLSTYALMAHARPAGFEFSDLTIDRSEIYPGDQATLSVVISNTGDFAGTYQYNLKLDDVAVETRTVDLAGLESQALQFTLTTDIVGEHIASIGDASASFTVIKPLAPARFMTSNLAVSPSEVADGDSMDIFVLVMNAGDLPGEYQVTLKIDDEEVQNLDIQLDGGESKLLNFSAVAGPMGQHVVSINNLTAVYTVQTPADTGEVIGTPVDIADFQADPVYSIETGKIISTHISYSLSGSLDQIVGGGLSLKVYRDGMLLEEVPLQWLNQPKSDDLEYTPALGWEAGLYTCLAELRTTTSRTRIAGPAQFMVAPESVTKVVSWKILGIIISVTLAVTLILVTIVIFRRRDMLSWHY